MSNSSERFSVYGCKLVHELSMWLNPAQLEVTLIHQLISPFSLCVTLTRLLLLSTVLADCSFSIITYAGSWEFNLMQHLCLISSLQLWETSTRTYKGKAATNTKYGYTALTLVVTVIVTVAGEWGETRRLYSCWTRKWRSQELPGARAHQGTVDAPGEGGEGDAVWVHLH